MDFKFACPLFVLFSFGFLMRGINSRNTILDEMQHQNTAILTVKSIHGDIYDCVDLLRQPSLQDLSFDDYHKQKKILQRIIREKDMEKDDDRWRHKVWLGEGCPNGTVPIPQNSKNGKYKLSYNFTAPSLHQSLNDDYNGGTDVVGINVDRQGLKGAFATISIHHPEGVSPTQCSAARVRVQNFNGQTEEFVEAGWTVNPRIYPDDRTRFYTRWQGVKSTGCYNTQCVGFVITNNQIPIDFAFQEISDPWYGVHHDVDIDIQIGQFNNWYLKVNGTEIGYWRGEMFQNLATATSIAFAGEVYSQPPTRESPPMGSGQYKGDNPDHTAYMKNVQVRLDQFFVPPPSYSKIERSRCYLAGWERYSGGQLYGFNFLFGGPGGKAGVKCLDG